MKQSKKEFCGSIFTKMMERYNERAAAAVEEAINLSKEDEEEEIKLPQGMIMQGI